MPAPAHPKLQHENKRGWGWASTAFAQNCCQSPISNFPLNREKKIEICLHFWDSSSQQSLTAVMFCYKPFLARTHKKIHSHPSPPCTNLTNTYRAVPPKVSKSWAIDKYLYWIQVQALGKDVLEVLDKCSIFIIWPYCQFSSSVFFWRSKFLES